MALEILYIVLSCVVVAGLMLKNTNISDAGDTLIGGSLALVITFLIMCMYSYYETPELVVGERKVEVLSHYETPRGITFHYLNSNGRAESIDFTDAESYMKYKNGLLLYEQEFARFTTFGPDTKKLDYVLK